MPNMSLKKNEMPSQAPDVRNKNFLEVALGYTEKQALDEAQRCLHCKNKPCVAGCPVGIHIPDFIAKVAEGDFEAAYQIITQQSSLPAVCGRVCPQETQCEQKCVRGIKGEPVGIGRLERFVADWHNKNVCEAPRKPAPNGHKVAVIGSGPSGLTCAGDLAKKGYAVTVFEALHTAGGVLVYGIPEFRLPKDIVQKEIDGLKALGVDVQTNMVIGRVLSIDELLEQGYEAVFIGSGAGLPRFMNIPGENLKGVYSANEFLTRVNLMKAYQPGSDTPIEHAKRVAVVGGGNVAMDAARCAKRLGAEEVFIVYRRSEKELPARAEEVEHAKEEGIVFHLLNNPTQILGDENGNVKGMECIRMELGEPDASGRRRPVEVPGSEFTLDVDCVIMAIGTSPNPLIKSTTQGLETQKWGGIIVNEETGLTSREGVYAGGDAVTGPATVIRAVAAGKVGAANIDAFLGFHHTIGTAVRIPPAKLSNTPPCGRIQPKSRNPLEARCDFQLATCGADRCVVVTTADASSLRDAQHTVMELDRFPAGTLHLVVNRVRKKLLRQLHATIDDAIDKAGLPLLGVVPEDDALPLCMNRGVPILLADGQSAASAYRNIAKRLQGERVPLLRIR